MKTSKALQEFNPDWMYNLQWRERLQFVAVRPDWCRLTAVAGVVGQDVTADDLAARAYGMMGDEWRGHKLKSYNLAGFRGFSLGQASAAARGDLVLLERRGWLAEDALWQDDADLWSCTRIDLAADYWIEDGSRGLAMALYGMWSAARDENNRRGRFPSASMILGDKGESLYIGSRSSEKMLRVYDKTLESRKYTENTGRVYRFELELKGNTANVVFHNLVRQRDKRETVLMDLLAGFCGRFRIRIPDRIGNGPTSLPACVRNLTDDERTLGWVARTVAKPVVRLRAAGYNEILDALLTESR